MGRGWPRSRRTGWRGFGTDVLTGFLGVPGCAPGVAGRRTCARPRSRGGPLPGSKSTVTPPSGSTAASVARTDRPVNHPGPKRVAWAEPEHVDDVARPPVRGGQADGERGNMGGRGNTGRRVGRKRRPERRRRELFGVEEHDVHETLWRLIFLVVVISMGSRSTLMRFMRW